MPCFLDTFLEPMIGNSTVLLFFCERKTVKKLRLQKFLVFSSNILLTNPGIDSYVECGQKAEEEDA